MSRPQYFSQHVKTFERILQALTAMRKVPLYSSQVCLHHVNQLLCCLSLLVSWLMLRIQNMEANMLFDNFRH